VFAVMCAAHTAGYDYGLANEPADSVRRQVLRDLAAAPVPADLQARLKDFYRQRNVEMDASAQHTKYASFALLLDPAPRFTLHLGDRQPPPPVKSLIGFEEMMPAYYRAARLDEAWTRHRPAVVAMLQSFRLAVIDMVRAVLGYSRIPARLYLNRRLIIIPDVVNAPGIINAVHLGGDYTILASPTDRSGRYMRFFIHEYLHYLLDPGMEPAAARFNQDAGLRLLLVDQRRNAALQEEPFRAVAESLINAVELAVLEQLGQNPARDRQEMIDRDSPLLPYFAGRLDEFRQGEKNLADYVAEMLPKIEIQSMCAAAVAPSVPAVDGAAGAATAPVAAPASPGPAGGRVAALDEAGRMLQEGRLDEAEATLAALLREDPADPLAIFTLGQARFARKDFAGALGWYDRVLAKAGVPIWMRCWSLVRSGYCLLHQENADAAAARFREAGALSGDDRGAAAAARRALEQIGQ
jgi:tetratricopeptide (TPR) repeat protein